MKNQEDLVPELFVKKKKRSKKRKAGEYRDGWENLNQRGVVRLDASINGGISGVRVGEISGKGLFRVGHGLGSIGRAARRRFKKVSRDGDGDNKITNPLTGRDDLPIFDKPDVFNPGDSSPPIPATGVGVRRKKFMSQMESHIMRLSTGGIDSFELDLDDKITATLLRGRVHYWNRSGFREVKTSYRGNKFKAFATTEPKSGKNIKISGAMTSGAMKNDTPYIGDEKLIEEQAKQTEKFRRWKQRGEWKNFHVQHYDWWTFPIDKGSGPYGFMYDVSGDPLERLKKNIDYLESLRDASSMYMESVGWDMKSGLWIQTPAPNQTPVGNINQQRLFKIGRSLQIHELNDSFNSVRTFVDKLKTGGLKVGNEEYWSNPKTYVQRSSFKNSGGIVGRMGLGVSPKPFPGKNKPIDPMAPPFRTTWEERDARNAAKDKSQGDLTFDWKSEASRRDYIDRIWNGRLETGYANFNGAISPHQRNSSQSKPGFSPYLQKFLGIINDLGVHWGPSSSEGGKLLDQYGFIFGHSGTANDPEGAYAAQTRDLLGFFAPTINPELYWMRFESWIRNPFSTIRDPKTGNKVGVRYYFRDNRNKLIEEFNRRISRLYEEVALAYGYSPKDKKFIPLPEHEELSTYSPDDVMEYVRKIMDEEIIKMNLRVANVKTIEALRKELIALMLGSGRGDQAHLSDITPEWFQEYMQRNHPGYLQSAMQRHPQFLRRSLADALEAEQRSLFHDLIELILEDPSEKDLSAAEIKKMYFPEAGVSEEMIDEELNRQKRK